MWLVFGVSEGVMILSFWGGGGLNWIFNYDPKTQPNLKWLLWSLKICIKKITQGNISRRLMNKNISD